MIDLNNKIWEAFKGGYKIPYNAAIPLQQLEQTDDPEEIDKILEELWDELHHQGDVGLASYLAIPQLVRIGMTKKIFNWNILGLCAVIESCRHAEGNPILPPEFETYYYEGLENLKQFILSNINNKMDDTTYTQALSALALCMGRIKLGKAIMELEDDVLDEFLEQF